MSSDFRSDFFAAKLKEFASSRSLPHLDHNLVAQMKGFCLMAKSIARGFLGLRAGQTFKPTSILLCVSIVTKHT